LNADDVIVDGEVISEEQLATILRRREETVALSATMRNVVFWDEDRNAAVIIMPPGRLVLSKLPY
jgi:hypothetical protein